MRLEEPGFRIGFALPKLNERARNGNEWNSLSLTGDSSSLINRCPRRPRLVSYIKAKAFAAARCETPRRKFHPATGRIARVRVLSFTPFLSLFRGGRWEKTDRRRSESVNFGLRLFRGSMNSTRFFFPMNSAIPFSPWIGKIPPDVCKFSRATI